MVNAGDCPAAVAGAGRGHRQVVAFHSRLALLPDPSQGVAGAGLHWSEGTVLFVGCHCDAGGCGSALSGVLEQPK